MRCSLEEKRQLIEEDHPQISIAKQCELLGLARSSFYYPAQGESEENLQLKNAIDSQYTKTPFYGSRRMTVCLRKQGYKVNRKRIARLMREMGLQAVYPKRNLSKRHEGHKIYPYLLKGLNIERPDFVWASDITYIRMKRGFVYLVAVMDWYSRFVISWRISISMEVDFCIEALSEALSISQPEIFNSDQGAQYTSGKFTGILAQEGIQISMDGKGRCFDNIFVESLWRSVKWEEVYLKDYENVRECAGELKRYFDFYNYERPHQSLGYKTPYEVYQSDEGRTRILSCKLHQQKVRPTASPPVTPFAGFRCVTQEYINPSPPNKGGGEKGIYFDG